MGSIQWEMGATKKKDGQPPSCLKSASPTDSDNAVSMPLVQSLRIRRIVHLLDKHAMRVCVCECLLRNSDCGERCKSEKTIIEKCRRERERQEKEQFFWTAHTTSNYYECRSQCRLPTEASFVSNGNNIEQLDLSMNGNDSGNCNSNIWQIIQCYSTGIEWEMDGFV